jgi:Ca-activated chloride channel family protein
MWFEALQRPATNGCNHRRNFCIALLMIVASGNLAARAEASALEYKEIDPSGFPRVVSFVTVQDDAGASVADLTKDDFIVREDGQLESPIEVLEVTEGGESVTVALALDRSSSMQGQPVADAKSAASNFVRLLQSGDRAAIVAFNNVVTTIQPFSSNIDSLVAAISGIQATRGTAIYDAVIHTSNLTSPQAGRRVIVLLTDGMDTESRNSFDDALAVATASGIPIFTIGLSLDPGSPEETILITLANNTGGRYYRSPSSGDLQQIYAAIAAELRSQYTITYTTHNPTTDGRRRLVRIDVPGTGASSDTLSYRAPEYVVTIAPTATERVSPGREFTLDFEIPQHSNYLLHRMKTFTIRFNYNSDYLTVKQPPEQNILAGALFGSLAENSVSSSVDEANGVITLTVNKNPAAGLVEGRGMLARVTFQASEDMPDSTLLSFRILEHAALDLNDWPIATRSQDLALYSYGLIVWPGDTNGNGKVELTDVTMLGLHWNRQGGGRPSEQNLLTWKAQLAERYPITAAARTDADGSGNVDERDLIPVGLNWGKTKDAPELGGQLYLTSASTPGGRLDLRVAQSGEPNIYRLSVNYESQQPEGLQGVMLRIRYRDRSLRFISIHSGNAWPAGPLLISSNDQDKGVLSVGLMLTAGTPALQGGGEMLHLLVSADTPPDPGQLSLENAGMVTRDGEIHEVDVVSGVDQLASTPDEFVLHQAYPNPFNPATTIQYVLPEAGSVEFTVYSVHGQQVLRTSEEFSEGGERRWTWDGRGRDGRQVGSGIYVVRAHAKTQSGFTWHRQQKVTLLR